MNEEMNNKLKQIRTQLTEALIEINKMIQDKPAWEEPVEEISTDVLDDGGVADEVSPSDHTKAVEKTLKYMLDKGFKLPFGKYKGMDFRELPGWYAEWLYDEMFKDTDPANFSSDRYKVDKVKIALRYRIEQDKRSNKYKK